MYLEKIQSPEDVKKLDVEQLKVLAGEMRQALIQKLSVHGGHVGPNLGMVEATIAMHYVFDSPKDKMVFDVSHQSYCHKMLTGRAAAFLEEAKYDDVSGYLSRPRVHTTFSASDIRQLQSVLPAVLQRREIWQMKIIMLLQLLEMVL